MKPRSEEIDFTKGLLAIRMIFAHVIQFFGHGDSMFLFYFSLLTNLVSYSGFNFCFGYAAWCAYLSKPSIPWAAVSWTSVKCYLAFVLSGVSFLLLFSKLPITAELAKSVVFIQVLPGYSEFLISFSFLLMTAVLFKPLVIKATNSLGALIIGSWLLIGLVYISWGPFFALLPRFLYTPVGVLVSGGGFTVLPYACFFLGGVYLARHAPKFRTSWFIASIFLTAVFVILWENGIQVVRFPISAPWILFGMPLLYVYYGLARFVAAIDFWPLKAYISMVGRNVLFYLVISNLIIFTAKGTKIIDTVHYFQMYLPFVVIMAIIFFLQKINVRSPERRDV